MTKLIYRLRIAFGILLGKYNHFTLLNIANGVDIYDRERFDLEHGEKVDVDVIKFGLNNRQAENLVTHVVSIRPTPFIAAGSKPYAGLTVECYYKRNERDELDTYQKYVTLCHLRRTQPIAWNGAWRAHWVALNDENQDLETINRKRAKCNLKPLTDNEPFRQVKEVKRFMGGLDKKQAKVIADLALAKDVTKESDGIEVINVRDIGKQWVIHVKNHGENCSLQIILKSGKFETSFCMEGESDYEPLVQSRQRTIDEYIKTFGNGI